MFKFTMTAALLAATTFSACSTAPESETSRKLASLTHTETESVDSSMSEPFYARICVDPKTNKESVDYKAISSLPQDHGNAGKTMKQYLDAYVKYHSDVDADFPVNLKLVEQKMVLLNENYKLNRSDRVYASLSSSRPLRNPNCSCKKIALSFNEERHLKGYAEDKNAGMIDTIYIDKKLFSSLAEKEKADFFADLALLRARPTKAQSRTQCTAYL